MNRSKWFLMLVVMPLLTACITIEGPSNGGAHQRLQMDKAKAARTNPHSRYHLAMEVGTVKSLSAETSGSILSRLISSDQSKSSSNSPSVLRSSGRLIKILKKNINDYGFKTYGATGSWSSTPYVIKMHIKDYYSEIADRSKKTSTGSKIAEILIEGSSDTYTEEMVRKGFYEERVQYDIELWHKDSKKLIDAERVDWKVQIPVAKGSDGVVRAKKISSNSYYTKLINGSVKKFLDRLLASDKP